MFDKINIFCHLTWFLVYLIVIAFVVASFYTTMDVVATIIRGVGMIVGRYVIKKNCFIFTLFLVIFCNYSMYDNNWTHYSFKQGYQNQCDVAILH
jgi:hypothetical protein